MKTNDFPQWLAAFLTNYLPTQRNVSADTIRAYRDTFVLFLRYCRDVRGWHPDTLCLKQIDAPVILDFLDHLKKVRKSAASTRNHRLAALRSFFRYLQAEMPEYLAHSQRILAIRAQRHVQPEMHYLMPDEMKTLLSQPDQTTKSGRRDAMLLSLLYDSGARVHEIITLRVGDIRLDTPATVRLTGKGGKIRIVPLMSRTVQLLTAYMKERELLPPQHVVTPLFTNRQGASFSRFGVRYILGKYMKRTRAIHPGLKCHVSPHTLRRSKAMHLLEAGIPLVIIRDFLGHRDIMTTEIYARASPKMKRDALGKIDDILPPTKTSTGMWIHNKGLLAWLQSI